ncbi:MULTISPECIES: MipA/OmpV family protein [unclassified Pseudomonas]|uniref:MipA/OmpV family protein n=1 Tax=unclassified Pseudomonas TaxID=196821 RepID=UPI0019113C71|nr:MULTISPECIES: MipA/OmpV family protein [unclassified Pseudomonas]MBK5553165.1 MipA/OmpV family protein [Pseudomonas sp. TH03]MEB0224250.1 MipA/OmpV family protein [Pseudomonas sp. 5S1]MEB0299140.1 MipA/OmpV family protein [Pseudomonas sp. 10S4]WPX17641.1 MipA/OmpV family protein [Pseudomonas sp. 10S4]
MFRSMCLSLTSLCLLVPSASLRAEDWRYTLRAGAASVPRYSGSDERTVAPLLGAKVVSPYGVFLDTEKGLGWAFDEDDFGLSVYIGASDVRKDRKTGFKGSDELNGMGSIKARPVIGLDGTYHMGPIILGASFEHALEKDDDDHDTDSAWNRLKLSISAPFYKGDYGSVVGSLNSQFGDSNYMRTWYGVSNAQASRSQFRAYDTHGGMVSRGADLTWSLPIDEQWSFTTVLAVQYLAGEAADSPIVERRLQTSVAGQVVYTF